MNDIVLPGWSCEMCKVFNGEAKEPRDECRACGHRPCPPRCPCLCHQLDIEDPGPHHILCAYADSEYQSNSF